MGKPLPEDIYRTFSRSATGKGLSLSRGPDSRSFNPSVGKIAKMMREVIGMDD